MAQGSNTVNRLFIYNVIKKVLHLILFCTGFSNLKITTVQLTDVQI